ncbi:TIGR03757 family integrating conjugative element protein [Aliikangiella maris]|uniref:TIGR03757 family integrating conjugative element protein n=2 Tax=Aliikangiella maris TaxID=3162458 RepID=A0ABV2BYE5_9GAMM
MKIYLIILLIFSKNLLAVEPDKMIVVVNDEQKSQLTGVVDVSNYLNKKNADFKIYSLDDVNNFERKQSEGLPADEEKAKEIIKKKYDKLGEKNLQQMIMKAYAAKILTLRFQLEKYPAIIFDDSVVVYGEFNLNNALNAYLEMEENQ